MKMAVKRFGKILVLVSILSGFNLTKAYSADGLLDGGLYVFGKAIQKEFQSRNDRDTEDYVTTSRPISPFAFSSSSLSDDFDGEEEPD